MVDIELHGEVVTPASVARAAHRYTDTCFVDIRPIPDGTRVTLTPKDETLDLTALAGRFRNDALDEQLRATVRAETRELHVALIDAALRGAKQGPSAGSS